MKKPLLPILIGLFTLFCLSANAQENLLILKSMKLIDGINLSEIDQDFDDLKEATYTSFDYMNIINDFIRIGGGSLSVSGKTEDTELLMVGGGLNLEFTYVNGWYISAGSHFGGMSVMVIHTSTKTNDEELNSGKHYQGGGFYNAPYLTLGLSFQSFEIALIACRQSAMSGTKGFDTFNATYAGLRLSSKF